MVPIKSLPQGGFRAKSRKRPRFLAGEYGDLDEMWYKLKMKLWMGSVLVFVANLPFGYWRAGTKRFSAQWVLAIHLPVPLIISIRLFGGLGWQLITFPFLMGPFIAGQWVGGRLRDWRRRIETSSLRE